MKDNYLNTQSNLAMKGAGYYSAKTAGAKNAIDKTKKVIENALKTIPSTEIPMMRVVMVMMEQSIVRP